VISGLAYQFGGVAGSFGTNRTMTGSLAYNGPNFTVAGFVTQADINHFKHTTESVGGNVQISPLIRVNAGYFHYTADQAAVVGRRRDNAWTVSAKFTPPGKLDYELGYQVMDAKNAGLTGGGFVQNAFSDTSGVKFAGSGKRKTFYASTFYHLDNVTEFYLAADHLTTTDTYKASQANGFMSQTELGLGMRFKF
jgi:hypothetical protein